MGGGKARFASPIKFLNLATALVVERKNDGNERGIRSEGVGPKERTP